MAKTFVIIDDSEESQLRLIEAIQGQKEPADSVVAISAEGAGGERTELSKSKLIAYRPVETRDDLLKTLTSIAGDMIILLDIDLPRMQKFEDFTGLNAHASRDYASYLADESRRVAILIHSKDYRADRVRDAIRAACSSEEQKGSVDHSDVGLDASADSVQNTANGIVMHAIALYERSPLHRLWRHSMSPIEWFVDTNESRAQKGIMLHGPEAAWKRRVLELEKAVASQTKDGLYESTLNAALGFSLPAAWFDDQAAFTNVHQNLKRLCGATYQGCGGSKNLSVGAVFLVAMMAHYTERQDLGQFAAIKWSDLTGSFAPFLWRQAEDEAIETATSLFRFFVCMFRAERKLVDGELVESRVKEIVWEPDGKGFVIMFNWSSGSVFHDKMRDGYGPFMARPLPLKVKARISSATDWLMRLLACMNLQEDGFGHPGRIYMRENALYVNAR